jgi:hypothetical protein
MISGYQEILGADWRERNMTGQVELQIMRANEGGVSMDRLRRLLPKMLIAATAALYILVIILAAEG